MKRTVYTVMTGLKDRLKSYQGPCSLELTTFPLNGEEVKLLIEYFEGGELKALRKDIGFLADMVGYLANGDSDHISREDRERLYDMEDMK